MEMKIRIVIHQLKGYFFFCFNNMHEYIMIKSKNFITKTLKSKIKIVETIQYVIIRFISTILTNTQRCLETFVIKKKTMFSTIFFVLLSNIPIINKKINVH